MQRCSETGPAKQSLSEPPGEDRPKYRSETLLAGGRQVIIEHRGQEYVLRLTASGKLILTK
jgi:hemin uptake protein HemP